LELTIRPTVSVDANPDTVGVWADRHEDRDTCMSTTRSEPGRASGRGFLMPALGHQPALAAGQYDALARMNHLVRDAWR
jgi:hypothetical protein